MGKGATALVEYTLRGTVDSIVLPADTVQRLLQSGNGDAALCYLALAQRSGTAALHWSEERLMRALTALETMGLAVRSASSVAREAPPPESPRAEYTNADLLHALEGNEFRTLAAAVDSALGKKLTTPDQKLLLGLYDDLGLSADVIFLLVNFCMERSAAQYGEGRKPTMRQIEREGYAWVRMGLMDQDSASAYIRRVHRQRQALPRLMRLLGLGERKASASEEKYLCAWSEMGFEDAVIELAYDKTMLKCKELKWPYMNKILTSWHGKGLHTLAAVEAGDRPAAPRPPAEHTGPRREEMEEMERMLRQMREDGKGRD